MRIVIDMQGAQTESRFRGIGRYTMGFAQGVVRNRGTHEVVLALSGEFPETIEIIRSAFLGLLPQENIRVWYFPCPVAEATPGNEARRKVAELIRQNFLYSLRPDVIHVSSLFEGYLDDAVTGITRSDRSIPISVSLFDLIPLRNPKHYLDPNPRFALHYHRKVEQLKKADIYLAISEFARQEGLTYLGVPATQAVNVSTAIEPGFRPFVINEVAATELRQRFGLSRPFVLYTGGVDERKNLRNLIEAYSTLPAPLRSQHQLLLAGRMPEKNVAALMEQSIKAGLGPDEVCFTGYVSDDELVQLYNLCRLFVFPSWHEGFGLPALEAMACGAPVIAANTSSLPEVVGLDDALFDPMNTVDIAAKMTQALLDTDFRNKLREHGLRRAKHFSWDETAKRAIAAWETMQRSRPSDEPLALQQSNKPKLAFVSPLPPERTGIADYSAELLPFLAAHYDIEIVVEQDQVSVPWINQHCKVRDVDWLRAHAHELDRVLYQVGNSPFHRHMLSLIEEIPGTVVLHDFYLSGLMAWLELHAGSIDAWTKSLYAAHGYGAVVARYRDPEEAKRRYPVNREVLRHAEGVIVHSAYSRHLAKEWYGDKCASKFEVIPLLRGTVDQCERYEARKQLGLNVDAFIVCSFGFLDPTKLNHRLLDAWLASALANDKFCHLIFVGENHGGDYGTALLNVIQASDCAARIRITGFASALEYRQYLAAADMAVQFRTQSRGETSAAVLDCMGQGLPTVINSHGAMAELDHKAVWMLPDEFENAAVIEALESLWRKPERRTALGELAQRNIQERHKPETCAASYARAIEHFHAAAATAPKSLINAIAAEETFVPTDSELLQLSTCIANTLPKANLEKQLLLDVSASCRHDLRTGIERVARALLLALLKSPPAGYRVEPVYLSKDGDNWNYRYARRYTLGLLEFPSEALDDEVVTRESGDVLVLLDLSDGMLVQAAEGSDLFTDYRNRGVAVYSIVYDLLPVRLPEVFPPSADQSHRRWLETVAQFDGAIGISKAVADDLMGWLNETGCRANSRSPFHIGWFHLGADMASSAPSKGRPDDAAQTLQALQSRHSFLMVGTVEPRKGYTQAIEAFDILWEEGLDVNLVIVGKEGWAGLPDAMRRDLPKTVARLRNHPERNKRLFWLEGISDEYLEDIYAASQGLIAASYGEGFGLPLIEAAQRGVPVIARDLPVFREVVGEHAFYFEGNEPQALVTRVRDWLTLFAADRHPKPIGRRWNSWDSSAKQLCEVMLSGCWYRDMVPSQVQAMTMDRHLDMIHRARTHLVSTQLPAGEVILDLGGANCPLYKMGYAHAFKKLYLIDLPPEARHDMYKDVIVDPDCAGGEVIIRYGDMTELDSFADASADFIWSGQSIEHVPYEKGLAMCRAAYRVLKPGAAFCLDTPNRLVTEIHTRDVGGGFIHPEHCIEYRPDELKHLIEEAGFEIEAVWGICEMNNTVASGVFCYEDFLFGRSLTPCVEKAYIQYFQCRKP